MSFREATKEKHTLARQNAPNLCHPERCTSASEANRRAQSKDPLPAFTRMNVVGSSHDARQALGRSRHESPPILRLHRLQPLRHPLHRHDKQHLPPRPATQTRRDRRLRQPVSLRSPGLLRKLRRRSQSHRTRETTKRLETIKEDHPDRIKEPPLGRPSRNLGSPTGLRRRINQDPINPCPPRKLCHPERSTSASEASRRAQSKDPLPACPTVDVSGSSHDAASAGRTP